MEQHAQIGDGQFNRDLAAGHSGHLRGAGPRPALLFELGGNRERTLRGGPRLAQPQ